jgi:SAM-dependent methyltransferase
VATTPDPLLSERAFHDRQARARIATFAGRSDALALDDAVYLDHETWIRPGLARLGDVAGLHVLDYGCGHGMAAVVLARRGARVTAFDLSEGYLSEARRRAAANGVRLDLVQADGQSLPFADATFDRVWGNAVLHHLDIDTAGRELFRVMRSGGVAVFCEPWGENPLLRWARRRLPYRGKERTAAEEPLRLRQMRALERIFPAVEFQGHQLLSMVRRVLRPGRLTASLERCDALLLRRLPGLRCFCRYAVLTLRR